MTFEAPLLLGRVSQSFPESIFVVSTEGKILDANHAASRLFGKDKATLCDLSLSDLLDDSEEKTKRYLENCARSLEPVPGSLVLKIDGDDRNYRCAGGVLEPARPDRQAVIFIRLLPRRATTVQFRKLTDQIDRLGREVETRLRAEQILDNQRLILEEIAKDAPLKSILGTLTSFIDSRSAAGARSSVLLLDAKTRKLRHGAASSLPAEYCDAIDGLSIGPSVGSCGTAAYLNQTVITADIGTDPNWEGYTELAFDAGLRACYSTPITGAGNEVLGTFALYYDNPREPDAADKRLIALMARTAALAIERCSAAEEIRDLLERERVSRAEAEEANRSKDEFLAMVSHELRNPLNAILGWAKVLTMAPADQKTLDDGLAAIERNAMLQAQLINEILDYSRIKAGKLTLEYEPTDIVALVRETVDSVRPTALAKDISLGFTSAEPSPQIVSVDPSRVQQVVSNIVGNALKFTESNGSVNVHVGGDAKNIEIRVEDTGCGIATQFLPHVFERFRQQDGTKQRKHEGLGLGLAIARQVVELHNGEVTAHSDGVGKGASFTVVLPRLHQQPASSQEETGPIHLHGLKILAVDDAADTRSLLVTLFTSVGADVSVAANGNEALDRIQANRPDLLLCDIGMPGMDGYEVISRLRAREKAENSSGVPAIALTAYARSHDRKRALDAGFDAHMAKPIDPSQLLRVVASTAIAGKEK